jgi:hypothetical protein
MKSNDKYQALLALGQLVPPYKTRGGVYLSVCLRVCARVLVTSNIPIDPRHHLHPILNLSKDTFTNLFFDPNKFSSFYHLSESNRNFPHIFFNVLFNFAMIFFRLNIFSHSPFVT